MLSYKVVFFVALFFGVESLSEGERCSRYSSTVVCRHLWNCPSAIDDLKNGRSHLVCGFDKRGPIVCCYEGPTTTPAPTTTSPYTRPTLPSFDLYKEECPPVPLNRTAFKTGQKAWDKCIEYQEQLVYPCESIGQAGGHTRVDRCGHNSPEPQLKEGEITDTTYEEYPHMVLMGYGAEAKTAWWWCGAAVISDTFILTSARCTVHLKDGNVPFVIVGGLVRPGAEGSGLYSIKRVIRHPDFSTPYHDIALMETETRITLNRFVVPACLPVGDDVQDDRPTVVGWFWRRKHQADDKLQKVMLPKFPSEECVKRYPVSTNMNQSFDANTQLCYADKTKSKDTCRIYGGSPLHVVNTRIQCMYTIVGLTSLGSPCGGAEGGPLLSTKVAAYVPWIESIVWP